MEQDFVTIEITGESQQVFAPESCHIVRSGVVLEGDLVLTLDMRWIPVPVAHIGLDFAQFIAVARKGPAPVTHADVLSFTGSTRKSSAGLPFSPLNILKLATAVLLLYFILLLLR